MLLASFLLPFLMFRTKLIFGCWHSCLPTVCPASPTWLLISQQLRQQPPPLPPLSEPQAPALPSHTPWNLDTALDVVSKYLFTYISLQLDYKLYDLPEQSSWLMHFYTPGAQHMAWSAVGTKGCFVPWPAELPNGQVLLGCLILVKLQALPRLSDGAKQAVCFRGRC